MRKKHIAFAGWLAVGLIGQAVALQLVQAGPLVRYQHYHTSRVPLWTAHPVLLLWFPVQTLLVIIGLGTRLPAIVHWLRSNLGLWRGLGVAAMVVLTSAAVQADARAWIIDLSVAAAIEILNLATLVVIVASCPAPVMDTCRRFTAKFLDDSSASRARGWRPDPFALTTAVWVTAIAAVLNVAVYERHPHITDEAAYVVHARILASGALSVPAPPVPEAFTFYLLHVDGDRLYSVMPPGWPMLLAVGTRMRVPWLVNPLLGGINILLTFALLRQLYDRRTARLVVAMLAVSPWFVFMAMNFMNHTATLTCALAAALGVLRATRGRALWTLAAGTLAGVTSIIRPLDGLILAAFLGGWTLWLVVRRQLRLPAIAWLSIGTVGGAALVLPYNAALTGTPTSMPVNSYMANYFGRGSNAYGFGPDRGFGWAVDPNPGHSVEDAVINMNLNAFSTNVELFGWSTGSLLLVALALFLRRMDARDYAMVPACALVIAAYFPYYYAGGPDFGARYWYLLIIPCTVLAARGLMFIEATFASPWLRGRAMLAAAILASFAVVNYFPWRSLDKHRHSWGMRPDVRSMSTQLHFGRSLILIRGAVHPDYASAAVYNPLDYAANAPIYAWDRNADVRRRVLEAYSDRMVWILNGPTITGRGYEVAQGPVPARELLTGAGAVAEAKGYLPDKP